MSDSPLHDGDVDYESLPPNSPLYHQLLAGAFAGIMEHSVMFPIDALKTRIQSAATVVVATATATGGGVSATMPSQPRTGLLSQIAKISSAEGSFALWKGVQSVILGAGPAHAVYFGTYEICKKKLIKEEDRFTYQPLKTALSGAAATTASDALMNPFDTIKQRMQLNPKVKVWQIAHRIYKTEGLSAFYYSYPTTLAMNIPFTALNFVVYESSTNFFNPSHSYNPLIHCICGGLSGTLCAAITTPLDCIKTVLQVRGSDSVTLPVLKQADTFKKATTALVQVYGWRGFWRGLKPRIVATMPATAISWTAYECAKHFLTTASL
ncbi:similar to Saccharomyces cerevisiae YJL133W MRS3 Iron transporter that mediates Fe2+ transport across the inner mitochondrial membrane [Maudiozyma barnettii]|uniref:Similar to Saccharomyces cerevisiae YJL133W MRS3 Iron transporter that mediates Fe2+ transport across the inner mitochondrial membrane n=1 Tax=Maudiozyma barnettii TaxID=61262 RepID=A0A8H2VGN5_9SACH|nr:Fe(2+) transporter [Kazachstania barnettii]CAB4255135.1 similar to Saccharomyces cerevisiae YJL133W MRS3 Iron transporter that mediates Fe2+ transport across the inner mitochondrial membrane [Kazachstania barnettii]CAD1783406.1 similar to Saccharomyces cerevisiae YJL133W MRS3 Iron transporter that mediates Fe2+ transport across the inner mitochondrial membrane [Kazachstania barnettii]